MDAEAFVIAEAPPGAPQTGDLQYRRGHITSHAVLAAPGDIRSAGDPRDFHETVANARVHALVGPD